MKRVIILLAIASITILFSATDTYSQTDKVILQTDVLLKNKKYASAYKVIEKAERNTKNIDYFLKRLDILLKYGISSNQHQTFYLKDIKSEKEILNFNEKSKGFLKIEFNAISIFDSLLKLNPNNCKLNKALGEYYFDAYQKYDNQWILPKSELLQKVAVFNDKAVLNNCADAINYFALGQVLIQKNKYKESIYFFFKAAEKDTLNPIYQYNLAYAYLFVKNNEKAIEYAKKALLFSNSNILSSDANRLIGQAYSELKLFERALEHFNKAQQLDSTTNANKLSILNVYLRMNKPEWEESLNTIYQTAKLDANQYTLLEQIFESNNALDKLLKFYEKEYNLQLSNDTLAGNLLYFMGRIQADTDVNKAKELFEMARLRFEKVYEKDHSVFAVINESIEALNELTEIKADTLNKK